MKLFTIFGDPISHSISPQMHNLCLNGLNINGCYSRTLLKDSATLLQKFHALKLDGANVTVPHKEVAFTLCDEVDIFAKSIGAVNTLVKKDGLVYGYNTDAPGFYKAIEEFGNISSAIILGAGGTSKAIATILKSKGISTTVLNRSHDRLNYFHANGFNAFSWDNFTPNSYDLIINTTSAGLSDESLPLDIKILHELMGKATFAFDVIYNKNTPFLELAKSHSLTCKDGRDMLLYQGVLAFNLFFDNKLDIKKITLFMRQAFKL